MRDWLTREQVEYIYKVRGVDTQDVIASFCRMALAALDAHTDHAAEVERLQERIRVLEEALESIAVIQDCPEGGDWDEIKLAREIAQAALAQPQQKELE